MIPKSYRQLKRALETTWAVRPIMEALYERQFAKNCTGCFRGVYASFAEANDSAPRTKKLGFNCPEYAAEFEDRRGKIYSFDYPMLFWLKRLLFAEGCRLFDLGGHVGTHFYAYSRYLEFPSGFAWVVCDLPEITAAGAEIAAAQRRSEISFTNRIGDADGADILVAAGSLQYVEAPSFSELLESLRRKPPHILINKLPLYDGDQFVTLQNGGAAFHPQYVFNRQEFLGNLSRLGYDVVDTWDVETHSGYIPFYPDRSFRCHSGMYLTLRPQ